MSGFNQFRMHEKSGFQSGLHILYIYILLSDAGDFVFHATVVVISANGNCAQLHALIVKYGYFQDSKLPGAVLSHQCELSSCFENAVRDYSFLHLHFRV